MIAAAATVLVFLLIALLVGIAAYLCWLGYSIVEVTPFSQNPIWLSLLMGFLFIGLGGTIALLVVRHVWVNGI